MCMQKISLMRCINAAHFANFLQTKEAAASAVWECVKRWDTVEAENTLMPGPMSLIVRALQLYYTRCISYHLLR